MCRRIRFCFVVFVAVVKLTSSGPAMGQLSRARKAVRKAPVVSQQPPRKAAPAEAEPEPEPRPPAAAPSPRPVAPKRKPKPEPSPVPVAVRTQPARSLGSLGRARQQVRPAPVQQPVVQPRPPRPSVNHRPPQSRLRDKHRPAPFQSFHRHQSRPIVFAPAPCIHETVIINEIASPPVTVFEQHPVDSPQPVAQNSQAVVPSFVEGCVVDQPDYLTPQCSGPLRFKSFPYEFGNEGIMAFGVQKQWSGSALFEYGSSFDGLDRRGFGFLLEHSSRIGFDVKWDSYIEDIGGGLTDELHLTDINVLFRVAQSPNYLVRAGLGANILGDAFGTDGGFNLTAKADFFPTEPLVVSGEIDVGTIGDAEMFHVAGKVGLMMDRFELFGGYDYRTIGGVPLQGAMIGLQVWF